MKKSLFIALAAMGFVACAEKAETNVPVNNGEKEQSYMAVTFTADDLTRAEENLEFAEGTDKERAVKSAYVFFFKENGEAFYVTDGDDTSTNSGPNNYIKVELDKEGENMDNVSDVNKSVLVLKNYKGEYPAQVVAVINWNPTEKASYKLSELQTKITTMGDDTNGYVMSNAVYMDHAGKAKYATDLRIENIVKPTDGESEEAAKARAAASPVVIQVERVAAKVEFSAKNNGKFAVGEVNGKTVFAQITGFELYNDYEESWLIKKIDTAWSTLPGFGFSNWNNPDWLRSYWAKSLGGDFDANNTFSWDLNGVAEDVNHSAYANGEAANPVYCGENTREWTEAKDVRTKVIVTAKLVEQDGTTPVELVQWYGKYYVTEEAGRTVVANTLANNYYFSTDNQNFTGIEGGDLKCVMRAVTDAKAFEVYFQLSDAGEAKTWYEYKDGDYVVIDKEVLNARLAAVEPALVYTDGMTYYYTDIKHLGTPGSTTEFGVVRNHVYRVRIDKIVGYGTPIYDGSVDFITPEKPVDVSTYVAAQINILSWRVVDPGYEI